MKTMGTRETRTAPQSMRVRRRVPRTRLRWSAYQLEYVAREQDEDADEENEREGGERDEDQRLRW